MPIIYEDADMQVIETVTANGKTVETKYKAGSLLGAALANGDTLRSRAQAALAANATFLALPAPTATQVRDQTILLTKECNGLIRLALNLLETTNGT